jgi:iron-sulfur cluster repair protein YtfE (RIC family)
MKNRKLLRIIKKSQALKEEVAELVKKETKQLDKEIMQGQKIIQDRLFKYLKRKGVSLWRLAQEIDIDYRTLKRVHDGKHVYPHTLYKILDYIS